VPVSVGIDLGTTFSAVAVVDQKSGLPKIIPNLEGGKITPSVIQFIDGKPIFGSEAESAFNAGEPDCVTTFKRYMGKTESYCCIEDKEYTAEQLSALLLHHLKNQAEVVLGDTIHEAVITVPAYFYSLEREATINAAKTAGLNVKKLIDEPNAAAMAYGLNNWRENAIILVYDLGGGTFDVTLTRMGKDGDLSTITTQGDHLLGGRDWDNRILTLLLDKFAIETGFDTHDDLEIKAVARGVSEGVKKQLSVMDTTSVTVLLPNFGKVTVNVSKAEFENVTLDLIERTGELCLSIVKDAGIDKADITDILLVGGSTRMPQVSDFLFRLFGKKPISHINPDEAVALGAAIQATKENDNFAKLSLIVKDGKKVTDHVASVVNKKLAVEPVKKLGNVAMISLRETTAHAMGIIAVSPDNTRYINEIIIPANHIRPVKVAKAFGFQTSSKIDNIMEIYVLQGDKVNPLDCSIPYKYVVSGLKHNSDQKGKSIIRIQYSYDNNGIINVEARQDDDRFNLPIRKEPVPSDMSKYALPIDPNVFIKQEPLSVVLAVDVSYSMKDSPINDAKRAMCDFVSKMDLSYTNVGVVIFADESKIVCPLTNDESRCIRAINYIDIEQAGISNSAHPFDDIKSMLKNESGNKSVIILTDGMWQCQPEAISSAKDCNYSGIETSAIGFGSADQSFLNSISSDDANALMVSQSELSQAFGSIAQSLGGSSNSTSGSDGNAADIETWDD